MMEFTPPEPQPPFRLLRSEETGRVVVYCALCKADLFPVGTGLPVLHDCATGEVIPMDN